MKQQERTVATGHARRVAPGALVRRGTTLAASLVLAVCVVGVGSAAAEKDVRDCVGGSTADVKLKAVSDSSAGSITVTAVVFSDDDDQWDWKMFHNDGVSAKGSVQAKDADRSFRIVRDMIDFSGVDSIGFRAENTATGEVCKASLDI